MTSHGQIPDPAVVVLVGASGAGKSTWAGEQYRPEEVVSSDALRAVVGSGRHDLDASADAFAVLDTVLRARSGRGLTVVVDTLGLDPGRRRGYLDQARAAGLPAVAVVFDTPPDECRRRNRARDRPVPAQVLDDQLAKATGIAAVLEQEGWDLVLSVDDRVTPVPVPAHTPGLGRAGAAQREEPTGLRFVFQLSRFPWGEDPMGWLADMAGTAADCGLDGIALMDHLIQIPQVGRAWDPIPEAHLTLGALAGLLHGRASSLSLGTLVSPVTFRRPGLVAKSVATLDVLTGGRAFCGIGAGWFEREHAAFGLGFPSTRERLDQLEETAETLRALWAPGTKAYRGKRVTLPETTCYPRPVSDIPIIVGGGGESRTLRIAAEFGDACNVRGDHATVQHKGEVLRRHCAEVGRDPAEVALTVLDLPVVGADRAEVADLVERFRGRTPAAAFAARHTAGTIADHVGRYRLFAEAGVSTVFVAPIGVGGPADLERLAPVVAAFR